MEFPVLGYVATVIPPERYELYLRAHGLLCDFFPDGWPTVLDMMANDIGDVTVNDMELRLHSAIITQLEAMVRECNLDFHPHVDLHHELRQLYHIANGLFHIEQYANPVALESRFNGYESAHEQLAAVLTEVEPGFDADAFPSIIGFISPTCIERVRQILEDNITTIEPMLEVQQQVPVVQRLMTEWAESSPALTTLPFQHVGGSFDSYIDLYRSAFQELDDLAACRLLILCAVMAKLDEQNGRDAIGNAIQRIWNYDLRRGISISRQCRQIIYPGANNG